MAYTNPCQRADCPDHFHLPNSSLLNNDSREQSDTHLLQQTSPSSNGPTSSPSTNDTEKAAFAAQHDTTLSPPPTQLPIPTHAPAPSLHGPRRIIANFTPSWFIITMSTGVLSIIFHQLPYPAHWLTILSYIFFILNLLLFLVFTIISVLRYSLYPSLFSRVLKHPHQSLFLATFPVGLATLVNMTVLVCAGWGQGWVKLAWAGWWIVGVLATGSCLHLTWVIMSHRRAELAEMTALYLIPIVAVVIAATSGGLVASALEERRYQLWTLIISYIYWGIGTPLSWIILTLYFLRMTVHTPLKREVIVSLLLPIGPLGLSGFSMIVLGKLAKRLFPITHSLPHATNPGEFFYLLGFAVGLILWGFAIVWFIVAVAMIATSGGFPFNMGWWGFIFPVGVFTLLTISIGEELESRFFKVLACVLTAVCVIMWLVVAAGTIYNSITGKMFYAPCLGTDLFQRRKKEEKKEGNPPLGLPQKEKV